MADPRLLKSVGYAPGQAPSDDPYYGVGMKAQPTFLEKMVRMFADPNDPIQPMPMMIPSVGNLPVFKNLVGQALEEVSKKYPNAPQAFKDAVAFAMSRYPKMTSMLDNINPAGNYLTRTGDVGRYMPSINEALVSHTIPSGERPTADIVDTIMHEARHGVSNLRTPQIFNAPSNILEEKNAYQAGDTAAEAFRKYIKMLGQK